MNETLRNDTGSHEENGWETLADVENPTFNPGLPNNEHAYEEDIDNSEKEKREKIKANRAAYDAASAAINKSYEVYFSPFDEYKGDSILGDNNLYRDMVATVSKMNNELLSRLNADFFRSQAPLIIKDESKRNAWEKRIEDCATNERAFGFSSVEFCVEECLESLALGESVEKTCDLLKKYEDRPGASYQQINDIVSFSDRGEEFADYIGFSDIDFEKDSLDVKNEKIQKVAKKIGFEHPEGFYFR